MTHLSPCLVRTLAPVSDRNGHFGGLCQPQRTATPCLRQCLLPSLPQLLIFLGTSSVIELP